MGPREMCSVWLSGFKSEVGRQTRVFFAKLTGNDILTDAFIIWQKFDGDTLYVCILTMVFAQPLPS